MAAIFRAIVVMMSVNTLVMAAPDWIEDGSGFKLNRSGANFVPWGELLQQK